MHHTERSTKYFLCTKSLDVLHKADGIKNIFHCLFWYDAIPLEIVSSTHLNLKSTSLHSIKNEKTGIHLELTTWVRLFIIYTK